CGLKNLTLDILYQADSATPQLVDEFLQSLTKI
ncbi:TPA: flavodoxin family protein, partial [Enterobacter cloacae]|nr:flavodoxin family protein [Enterobacter cloacae]